MQHNKIKEKIIQEGKLRGLSLSAAKVLSTDPFLVGNEKDYRDARWIAPLWDQMMASRRSSLHLRGFHYWVQSQGIVKPDGEKYAQGVDPAKDWGYMLHCAQIARYLGIGKWTNLIDLKHPDPSDYDNYYVGSGLSNDGTVNINDLLTDKLNGLVDDFLSDVMSKSPRYDTNGYQTYHCEVWCEKNSMGFVIEPACRRFGATYQPLVGQASVEKVNMAAERAIKAINVGKRVRLFYVADFDRYGWGMVSAVARKLEFFLKQNEVTDADVKLTRLALNEEHINKFKLPKAPKHGEAVVELDALEAIHPGELAKIIRTALTPYFDEDSIKKVRAENDKMRDAVKEILEANLRPILQETFKDLNIDGMTDIDLTEVIDSSFKAPEPNHKVNDEDGSWVYDSERPYWEQYQAYKNYKSERVEEEM